MLDTMTRRQVISPLQATVLSFEMQVNEITWSLESKVKKEDFLFVFLKIPKELLTLGCYELTSGRMDKQGKNFW